MNNILLVGRFTKDPEIRVAGAGNMSIARFTLAVDRKIKKDGDEQTADFIPCVAFGKTSEFIEKYFRKGMRAGIEGRLQSGSYTNKNGDKVYTLDVIVSGIEFVESKREKEPASQPDIDGFMAIPDDIDEQLPFN